MGQPATRSTVARRLRSDHVLARLTARFVQRGPPTSLRSDHGPAFTATAVRSWLRRRGVTTLCIEPGSPWENGEVESFTGTLRDEGLNPEICTTLTEAQVLIERGRRQYNQVRPHSALGSRPPAPAGQSRPPHPTPPPGPTRGTWHPPKHWHDDRGQVTTRIPSSELRRHVGGPTSASEAGFLRSGAN